MTDNIVYRTEVQIIRNCIFLPLLAISCRHWHSVY